MLVQQLPCYGWKSFMDDCNSYGNCKYVGSYVGTHFAIKGGEVFIKKFWFLF